MDNKQTNLSQSAFSHASPTPTTNTLVTKQNQPHTVPVNNISPLPMSDTRITDSDATHIYIAPIAPHGPPDTTTTQVYVGTANGQVMSSSATATLPIPQLQNNFPTTVYIIPSFTNILIGIGPIYDENCTVLFTKEDITVFSPAGKPILTGWREKELPKLWRFALRPRSHDLPPSTEETQTTTLAAYSTYDLSSVEALVRYLHTAAGFPVKSTWLRAIKAGNSQLGQV